MGTIFLTAEWRELVMLNYEVDAALLNRFIPTGTEIDNWRGRVFVSLIGFRFLKTRVLGLSFPFHRNFEEVNLRFYVRRIEGKEVRRGVVFIREIVPRRAIAGVARIFYNENYLALPMAHTIERANGNILTAEYSWKHRNSWNRIRTRVKGTPTLPESGSQEQFIAEHYWGYAAQTDGSCVEYQVAHPPWKVWSAPDAAFEGDTKSLYGGEFAGILSQPPFSAFLAEGSPVTVHKGRRLSR